MSGPLQTFPASADYVDCGALDRVPRNVSELSRQPGESIPPGEIGFRHAPFFFHTRIEHHQPPAYYEDYLMTATYSAKMQDHQAAQAQKLVRLHGGKPSSFVEIGCGDGSFLRHVQALVPRVVGIEPSRVFAAEARAAGFEVVEGYMGTNNTLTTEQFDLFASRQVFEHLPDPVDVLGGVRKLLKPGAVGLIEVPNGLRALRLGRFFEFFPDHVQYYSVNSLVGLATQAGLNVIECGEAFGGDYLELWVRHEPEAARCFDILRRNRDETCRRLAEKIEVLARSGLAPVAVWGCGAKTLSILAAAPAGMMSRLACVFDSDPHKHGRFVPNSGVPVVSPERAAEFAPRSLFVLALSYREEIARLARERIPACRQIFTLDDEGRIVEL